MVQTKCSKNLTSHIYEQTQTFTGYKGGNMSFSVGDNVFFITEDMKIREGTIVNTFRWKGKWNVILITPDNIQFEVPLFQIDSDKHNLLKKVLDK
jgi:hypothetical protein